jgi:hypothetical protein
MDTARFDRLSRALARETSRRAMLRAAVATAITGALALRRVHATAECPGDWIWCEASSTCVNPEEDPENCGACGIVCMTVHGAGICCGSVCYDPMVSHENCGSCSNDCEGWEECISGECVALVQCAGGAVQCGGECVYLSENDDHCGSCYHACVGDPPVLRCCGGICVNPYTDPSNCGVCGNVCPDGSGCDAGICQGGEMCGPTDIVCGATCCPAAQSIVCCGDYCLNLMSPDDPANCGACGNACIPGAVCAMVPVEGPPGTAPRCVCPTGTTDCAFACADLAADPLNCGGCGVACAEGESCVSGACAPLEPSATSTPAEPTPVDADDPWQLWLAPAALRGAHVLQRFTQPQDDPQLFDDGIGPVYTARDFSRLAGLGASHVVIDHPAIVENVAPYLLDEALSRSLDRLVDAVRDAGLRSVIALTSGPGRPEAAFSQELVCQAGGCFAQVETAPDAGPATVEAALVRTAGWVAAWSEVARRYERDSSVIGYELMPGPETPDRESWRALATMLVEAIRDIDRVKPILLDVTGEPGAALRTRLVRGDRIVHAIRFAPPERFMTQRIEVASPLTYPGRFDGSRDGGSGEFDHEWVDSALEPVASFIRRYEAPVAIARHGIPRWQPGSADFLADSFAAFERLGVSDALWVWYPSAWPEEADAFDVTRGEDAGSHIAVDNPLLDAVRQHWNGTAARLRAKVTFADRARLAV